MQEFKLSAKVTVSVYTTILADTLEEAISIAENDRQMMTITTNNGDEETDCWVCEELDGTPFDICTD